MDVANLRRRTRCGLIRNLVSSLQDGDPSDGEEEEQTDLFQQILALTASLGDRAKMRMAEMIAGSGLGQMRALSGKFRSWSRRGHFIHVQFCCRNDAVLAIPNASQTQVFGCGPASISPGSGGASQTCHPGEVLQFLTPIQF